MTDPAEALNALARSRIGKVLREKWRIDTMLGAGGMAVVYSATHVNNGRRAAIKVLHPSLGNNAEVRTRFLREGYLANKVEHPGTVAVLDDDVAEDGGVFLVMELLEGETLEGRRERLGRPLPWPEVLSIGDRLLDVLAAAHDKGIVHRDIKPDNVFLTRDGAVKVLDFGIARIRALKGARLTLAGSGAIGTPAFMPPEQAHGRWDEVGPRADVWAVGATMFFLITGRLVHEAPKLTDLMLAAMTQPAPPIASVLPGLPPPVARMIDKALAFDAKDRWADGRSMQLALRAAYQEMGRLSMPSIPAFDAAAMAASMGLIPGSGAAAVSPSVPPQARAPVMYTGAPAAAAAAPVMATGLPVTVTGTPRKGGLSPGLIVVGAVGGAAVSFLLLWALVLRSPGRPAAAAAVPASASAPAVTASAAPPPSATAEPSAAPTASAAASADGPAASSSADAPEPTATAATPPRVRHPSSTPPSRGPGRRRLLGK
jgi:serine/threonine-protein kinase